MKITEIKPRRKRLSAVYIDGEFAVSLDTQTLIENRFDVGREIDDEDLHEIIKLSNERRAKEKALWLLSYREHSKKELEDKIRRTADEASAQKAVDRMEELGLVDDERLQDTTPKNCSTPSICQSVALPLNLQERALIKKPPNSYAMNLILMFTNK